MADDWPPPAEACCVVGVFGFGNFDEVTRIMRSCAAALDAGQGFAKVNGSLGSPSKVRWSVFSGLLEIPLLRLERLGGHFSKWLFASK